ncbi:MAG: hypothetical protein R3Y64_08990, partial [Peptostreptococcaceae bacterium]
NNLKHKDRNLIKSTEQRLNDKYKSLNKGKEQRLKHKDKSLIKSKEQRLNDKYRAISKNIEGYTIKMII